MEFQIELTKDFKEIAALNQAVQEWHHQNYPEDFKPFNLPENAEVFNRMLGDPKVFAWLAKIEDKAIDYLLCMIKEGEESEFQYPKLFLIIDQISVEEEYRKQGVTTKL